MDNLERLIIESKPTQCTKCKGKMFYLGRGKYYCKSCGYEALDDLGKIKKFLKENGDATVMFIAQSTGVYPEIIEMYLERDGFEIPKDSQYYLKCEKCGCSIRDGRFCSSCIQEVTSGIKALLDEDIREKSRFLHPELAGKMHFKSRR